MVPLPAHRLEYFVHDEKTHLTYVGTDGKMHNMSRKTTELLAKTLDRLARKIKVSGVNIRKGAYTAPCCENTTNTMWEGASHIELLPAGVLVDVVHDPPKIKEVELSSEIAFLGVPITAEVLLVKSSDQVELCYEWRHNDVLLSTDEVFVLDSACLARCEEEGSDVGVLRSFVDSSDDAAYPEVLHNLTLRITPVKVEGDVRLQGEDIVRTVELAKFSSKVYKKEFAKRHGAVQSLRVGTYNVLADCYAAGSEYGRDSLYKHVPPLALEMKYRFSAILSDILAMECDIVSLQEVGHSFFRKLSYVLERLGYHAWHSLKLGNGTEGGAVFYKRERFNVTERHTLPLGGALSDIPFAPEVLEAIKDNPTLVEKFTHVVSIMQVMVMSDVLTGKTFAFANTHLYYHPNGNSIRALQLHTIYYQATKWGLSGKMILTGDLNTTYSPYVVSYCTEACTQRYVTQSASGQKVVAENCAGEFLLNGVASKTLHFDMKTSMLLGEGGVEVCLGVAQDREKLKCILEVAHGCGVNVEGVELVVPRPMAQRLMLGDTILEDDRDWAFTDSEDGDAARRVALKLEMPFALANPNADLPYTTHTVGFTEVLDYTLYSPAFFKVLSTMPRIDFEGLKSEVEGLPTEEHPSDHIPVFTDFLYV